MLAFIDEWMQMDSEQREFIDEDHLHWFANTEFLTLLKKRIKDAERKKYYYLLTFTLKPGADAVKAKEYVIRIPERTPLQIIRCDYVEELTKNGVQHWHMSIVTTKALKKDRLQYYAQKYGAFDISKNKAQQYDEMLEYMAKTHVIVNLRSL